MNNFYFLDVDAENIWEARNRLSRSIQVSQYFLLLIFRNFSQKQYIFRVNFRIGIRLIISLSNQCLFCKEVKKYFGLI